MSDFEDINIDFEKRLYQLDEPAIIRLNKSVNSGELNNVVTARRKECYGILINEEKTSNVFWQLFFVSGNRKLEGALLEMNLENKHNALLVMLFSKFVSQKYLNVDLLDSFNTFQEHIKTMLEKIGFLTIPLENLEEWADPNPTIAAKGVRGIIPIRSINKVMFYKEFFTTQISPIFQEPQVYLLLNPNLNHTKIGRSKNPCFRERTLQSQEPDIVLIASWIAPAYVETFLHKKFRDKRIRGEWFNLNFNDLNEIKKYMDEKILNNLVETDIGS